VRLPNADKAVVDLRKLLHYCLSPTHPRGRHKARVFRDALGIGATQADWLRQILLAGAATTDATEIEADAYGTRWRIDIPTARMGKVVVIRSLWIIRAGEIAPRLVTCWVL
jgi:hypothetical protein